MSDYSVKFPVTARYMPSGGAAPALDAARPAEPAEQKNGRQPARNIDLEQFAKNLEKYVPEPLADTRLLIERDDNSGLFVYKFLDPETQEIVRQYPTEDMLRLMSGADEQEGLAVDDSI